MLRSYQKNLAEIEKKYRWLSVSKIMVFNQPANLVKNPKGF
jgi:hypothetical protein